MATFAVTFTRVVEVDVAMPDGPVPKELWNWPTEVVVAVTNAAYENIQDVGVDNIEPDTITRLDEDDEPEELSAEDEATARAEHRYGDDRHPKEDTRG